ncbi:uncharacterized protein LOC124699195 [Lolium rigidum]|uniref:uncharacterized protein LOC124699195 n=1 Tax=Lolium rigidum TaxID=89674 RepID=UPI001F5D3468|nr:uncharacterized protein LOC124699195 [Lolium rigidum]
MAPSPVLPRRLSLVVRGVTAAAAIKHPNILNYSLGPDSGSSSSSSTRSRSSRRFSSNAEQSTRSRRWWYDEAQLHDDYDEEEGPSFGASASWDQAFDEPWFAKVSRAYWYVLPLILASMLLATGRQAFLLAMAVPLAQSAASFAIRAFSSTFGRSQEEYHDDDDDYYSDYRSSGWEESGEHEFKSTSYSTKYRDGRSQQQHSWAKDDSSEVSETSEEPDDTDVFSASSSNTSRTSFGGWDELVGAGDDQYTGRSKRPAGAAPPPDAATAADNAATDAGAARSVGWRRKPQPETTTRRRPRSRAAARYTQSPLLMRLLVAVFPFLGSWFRIMH